MADPISTASGLLTLVLFAFQSSQVLYEAVASFQNNQRTVLGLKEELEALIEVLKALQATVTNTDTDLAPLKLPLLRCGKACKDFEEIIAKCTIHSGKSRTSFRDWAKLRYMDDDIVGFKDMLAGYKATIAIALGDANIRISSVTMKVLLEYKDMIRDTTSKLEKQLQEMDQKLATISSQGSTSPREESATRQQIEEERDSIQQCLGICAQVFAHIDQVQLATLESISPSPGASEGSGKQPRNLSSARLVTVDTFRACKEKISNTTTQLEDHLHDIDNRLEKLYLPGSNNSDEQRIEQERIREELESIRQRLAICAQASTQANNERINVFEDVSTADDGHQVLVSTIGDLITARRVTAGARSMQVIGQLSDDSLQQLSRAHSHSAAEKSMHPQSRVGTQFEGRYGVGVKLSAPDV